MEIIWEPKISFIFFFLIFLMVYLFYLSGEKKYQKDSFQTIPYFSGQEPKKEIKVESLYFGFFKDFEKLYQFLIKTKKENPQDYLFYFILGFILLFFLLCLI